MNEDTLSFEILELRTHLHNRLSHMTMDEVSASTEYALLMDVDNLKKDQAIIEHHYNTVIRQVNYDRLANLHALLVEVRKIKNSVDKT